MVIIVPLCNGRIKVMDSWKQQRWNATLSKRVTVIFSMCPFPINCYWTSAILLVHLSRQSWESLKWLLLAAFWLFLSLVDVGTLLNFCISYHYFGLFKKWNTEEPWNWKNRTLGTQWISQLLHLKDNSGSLKETSPLDLRHTPPTPA